MRIETEYAKKLKIKKKQQAAFRRFMRGQATPWPIREWIGLNWLEIKAILQNRMLPSMNWQNYGSHWVIDHLVPFWIFDLNDEAQLKLLWHPENLFPMIWKHNNHKQGALSRAIRILNKRMGYSIARERLIEIAQREDAVLDVYDKYNTL
jgi:hypothetical protein